MAQHRNLRKAAILLASLDAEHGERCSGRCRRRRLTRLRHAVESLGEIDAEEQGVVIEEFFRAGSLVPVSDTAGIELDCAVAASAFAGRGLAIVAVWSA